MRFSKYQALGNDYVVLAPGAEPPPGLVRRICDRHRGLGADGVLLPVDGGAGGFALRIFNPDGSEAGRSGNGVRIFARWLRDAGRAGDGPFTVATRSGDVRCRVPEDGGAVSADMGRVSFLSTEIPVTGPPREVLEEALEAGGRTLRISAATVGNPHCVVLDQGASPALARELGPEIERHPAFPERTNVQLVEVVGPHDLRLEIWERGTGYTLASGTSSCAAAAVCCRLGRCRSPVTAHMPGGDLHVTVGPELDVTIEGPVRHVADGVLARELLEGDA